MADPYGMSATEEQDYLKRQATPGNTAASTQGYGTIPGQRNIFAGQDPDAFMRDAFRSLGYSTMPNQSWISLLSSQVAPGLEMMFQLNNPNAQGGNIQAGGGLTGWLDALAGSSVSPANWAGGPLAYQAFQRGLQQLLSGAYQQEGSALEGLVGAAAPVSDQYQNLARYLQAMGAMNLTGAAQRAVQMRLRDLYDRFYTQVMPSTGAQNPDLIAWLAANGNGLLQRLAGQG